MRSDWKKVKLSDVVKYIVDNRGRNPDYYVDNGYPVIDNYMIKGDREVVLENANRFIDEEQYKTFIRKHIKHNDLLITLVGNGYGNLALAPKHKSVIIQNTIGIRSENELTNIFLFYYFSYYKHEILNLNIGAVQPSIKVGDLLNLNIEIPPLPVQQKIAKMLSSLDDKIENLRAQNKVLENIAQALFKRWFVDFEFPDENGNPYKSSGGRMIESELGLIPEGWRVGKLGDYVSETISGEYGTDSVTIQNPIQTICLRGTDLPDMKNNIPFRAPKRYLSIAKSNKCKLHHGDIVIEISGGTAGQSTGRSIYINNEILVRSNMPMTCVNFCKIIRPKDIKYTYFINSYFEFLYQKGEFFNLENGTTGIKNLNLKVLLYGFEITLPDVKVLLEFDRIILNMFEKIQKNNTQLYKLSNIRDALLPKLMKGEIEI